jgi:hypothetical protein
MAPSGVKGDVGPRSTTNPIFLPVLFHCTVVPTFTQKRDPFLPFAMLGVDEAALAVRFTSTEHGAEAEPQVLLGLHNVAGLGSPQAYLLLWADTKLDNITTGNSSEVYLIATYRFMVIIRLIIRFQAD